MSAKAYFVAALAAAFLGVGAAQAQSPKQSAPTAPPAPPAPSTPDYSTLGPPEGAPHPAPVAPNLVRSSWMTYQKDCACYGPFGNDGPIRSEAYWRNGFSVPFGKGSFAKEMEPGWVTQLGVRSLFFNPDQSAAWTVDLGFVHYTNTAAGNAQFPISILVPNAIGIPTRVNFGTDPGLPGVTLSEWSRNLVSLGLGREQWLASPEWFSCGQWRVGWDAGGRWGTSKLDLHEIKHRSDVIGQAFAAVHSDLEIPCGCCCKFQVGFRGEWSYTWSDILQQRNDADVMDFSFLITAGARY